MLVGGLIGWWGDVSWKFVGWWGDVGWYLMLVGGVVLVGGLLVCLELVSACWLVG